MRRRTDKWESSAIPGPEATQTMTLPGLSAHEASDVRCTSSCINPSGIEDGFRFCLVRLQVIEDICFYFGTCNRTCGANSRAECPRVLQNAQCFHSFSDTNETRNVRTQDVIAWRAIVIALAAQRSWISFMITASRVSVCSNVQLSREAFRCICLNCGL